MEGDVLGGAGGGNGRHLVLLHLVVVLEVLVLLLVILVVDRVLLGSLGEIDDLATGPGGNDVVEIDGALRVALIVVVLLSCTCYLLEI